MKRKKLLFVTTRLFWPTDEGHKVLLYNYCKGLYEHYNYDIYLYSFLEEGQDPNDGTKPDFIKKIYTARQPNIGRKVGNVLHYSLLSQERWSFQSSMFYSKFNIRMIQKLIEKIKPDSIIVDMIRLSPYYTAIKTFEGPKILFMEDALSKRYIRQIKAASTESGIAGRFRTPNKTEKRSKRQQGRKKPNGYQLCVHIGRAGACIDGTRQRFAQQPSGAFQDERNCPPHVWQCGALYVSRCTPVCKTENRTLYQREVSEDDKWVSRANFAGTADDPAYIPAFYSHSHWRQ